MIRIEQSDWHHVHELACDIANAFGQDDDVLAASSTEALIAFLKDLEIKYGRCSRITATIADYTEGDDKTTLYREALEQAKSEGDTENEQIIKESRAELP